MSNRLNVHIQSKLLKHTRHGHTNYIIVGLSVYASSMLVVYSNLIKGKCERRV